MVLFESENKFKIKKEKNVNCWVFEKEANI